MINSPELLVLYYASMSTNVKVHSTIHVLMVFVGCSFLPLYCHVQSFPVSSILSHGTSLFIPVLAGLHLHGNA